MEVRQKIETRVLRSASGRPLRLDYCLLANMEGQRLLGPYGLEIILTGCGEIRKERCENLTGDYRKAVSLIHVFASNLVTPASMLELLRDAG